MALPPQRPASKGIGILQDARTLEDAARQDKHRTETLQELCGELEEDLEALRARYDLFFIGIERREPVRERGEMKRRVARMKGEQTRNTGLRFRIETLNARYLSYERMWLRSAREKEAGTYHRDLVRARRRAEREAKAQPAEPKASGAERPSAPPEGSPAAAASLPAKAPPPARPLANEVPRSANRPTAGAPPPAAAPSPGGLSEAQLRALHAAYVEAKRACNEDTSRITYDGLAKTIARQGPELLTRFNARRVEWKVVVKDGRAVLKAVPRS